MKIKIEKKEIRYAALGVGVILFWTLVIRNMIAPKLALLPPIVSMLIYQFGLLIGIILLSNVLNGGGFKIKLSIITFIMILGINVITAPYMVSPSGVINSSIELWYVSTDVGFGTFWGYFLPQHMIWFFTYVITPTLLIFLLPIMISDPKAIHKALQ